MHFGVLRVINDDFIERGGGFGTHPHNDMEIITIPLEGALEHQDSMGNGGVIRKGDIQVMSAGTGISHSEFNASSDSSVRLLQIWVFPREKGIAPRYDQMRIADSARHNDFQQIISPYKDDEGLWIHQDAWFHLANFDKGISKEYHLKKEGNSTYIFVIHGKAIVEEQLLNESDGFGIWDTDRFTLEALEPSEILLMEVPVELPK